MIDAPVTTKSTAAERARTAAEPGPLVLVCLLAWLLPGAGHLWLGRRQKGIVFLLVLPFMFVVGLLLHGRLFPLACRRAARFPRRHRRSRRSALPYFLARMLDAGAGTVTAVTYEYGNWFLMAAGLLNALVILDAFDIAMGRK